MHIKLNIDKLRPDQVADLIRVFGYEAGWEDCDENAQEASRVTHELTDLFQDMSDNDDISSISMFPPSITGSAAVIGLSRYSYASFDEEAADMFGRNIDPRLLGYLIRQNIPLDGEEMTRDQKMFWLDVDQWVGPDYSDGLRTAANFIKRFNEFK